MSSDQAKGNNFLRLGVCVFMGIALLWGFSSPALTAQAADKYFTEYFESGKEYLDRGRFEEAVRTFKESLRLNPHLDEIDAQVSKETQAYLEKASVELRGIEEARRLVAEKRAEAERIREERAAKIRAERKEVRRRAVERWAEARKIRAERIAYIRAERVRAREEAARERVEEEARRKKEREERNR